MQLQWKQRMSRRDIPTSGTVSAESFEGFSAECVSLLSFKSS